VTKSKEIDLMFAITETSAETKAMRGSAKRLAAYLNDHLAHETFAAERVKRTLSENEGTPLRGFLEVLSWELEEDRDTLVRLMGQLGVRRKRVGMSLAWIEEKLGRLRLTRYSPLSILVELESLDLRIKGKLDTWSVLRSSLGERAAGVDFDELIRRAERQAVELERRRVAVAADALSYQDGSASAGSAQRHSPPRADRFARLATRTSPGD
jgi:hypothetical protein